MAAKKVGELVKEARTAAGLTQEKLAQKAGEGLTASDIGKCERGTADLTVNQLKKIAVACGVTQTSLVNAPKNLTAAEQKKATGKAKTSNEKATVKPKTTAAKAGTSKTAAKTTSAKTPVGKTTAAKTAGKTTAKTSAVKTSAKTAIPANANTSMKVTATEKKLVEAYREANSDMKKVAMKVLKGEYGDKVTGLLNVVGGGNLSNAASDGISDAIGNLLGSLLGGK